MRVRSILAAVWLLTLSACGATTIVTALPHRGIERGGDRTVRLFMDRVRIDEPKGDERDEAPTAQICFQCSSGSEAPRRPVYFKLPLSVRNGSSRPWIVVASMFHLEPLERRPGWHADRLPQVDLHYDDPSLGDPVLFNVPPRSSARFSVLIHLTGTQGTDKDSDLYGTYRLTVTDEKDEVILERELLFDRFTQAYQLRRLAGGLGAALLAVGLL